MADAGAVPGEHLDLGIVDVTAWAYQTSGPTQSSDPMYSTGRILNFSSVKRSSSSVSQR